MELQKAKRGEKVVLFQKMRKSGGLENTNDTFPINIGSEKSAPQLFEELAWKCLAAKAAMKSQTRPFMVLPD